MKNLKCPLCGNEMQLRSDEVCSGYYIQLYYYECIGCPLATTPVDSAQEAEKQIKDLISKFPPVMRVQKGDKIIYFNNMYHRQGGVVMGVDFTTMRILLEDGSTPPDMVVKWPWELEQKGGNND